MKHVLLFLSLLLAHPAFAGDVGVGNPQASGNFFFYTTPATGPSAKEMVLSNTGLLQVGSIANLAGTGAPGFPEGFAVGTSFIVDALGNITAINGVTTSWPATQGGVGTYLKNDGSGNLSWATVPQGAAVGGTFTGATAGSVVFAGTGTFQQDNAQFFWDDTNHRLGIGTTAPAASLSVGAASQFRVDSSGNTSTSGTSQVSGQSWFGTPVNTNTAANVVMASNGKAYALQVTDDGTQAGNGFLISVGSGIAQFTTNNAIPFKFGINGVEGMRIDASANVNVGGNATPTGKFSVGATSQFQVDSSGNASTTGTAGVGTRTIPSGTNLVVANANTAVSDGGTNSAIYLQNTSPTGQTQVTSTINGTTVAKWRTDYAGNINWVAYAGGHDFFTGGDSGTGTVKMSISNAGLVGIDLGTTAAKSSLDVNGGVAVGTYAGATAAPSDGLIVSGNVGIGTSNPGTTALVVSGSAVVSSTVSAGSGTGGQVQTKGFGGYAMSWSGATAQDTGVKAYVGNAGGTTLVVCSNNSGTGASVISQVDMIESYFDSSGGAWTSALVSHIAGSTGFTYSLGGNNDVYISGPSGNNRCQFYGNG